MIRKEHYKNFARGNKLYVIVTSLIVILVLGILQPFGIAETKEGKWILIFGCGLLNAVSCLLSDLITTCLCRLPYRYGQTNIVRDICFSIFNILLLSPMICTLNSVVHTGSVVYGWIDDTGVFTFENVAVYYLYVASVSFFALISLEYIQRNNILSLRLKQAVKMNQTLADRLNEDISKPDDKEIDQQPVIIENSAKCSVRLLPCNFVFAESNANYVDLYYIEDLKISKSTIRCTLKQMCDIFSNYRYILKCHRAFIVNVNHIIHFEGNSKGFLLTLDKVDRKIPVSRAYIQQIQGLIGT